ncbi:MAG: alpha/beta hydrolase family protein [Fimbriiglobus sp.]
MVFMVLLLMGVVADPPMTVAGPWVGHLNAGAETLRLRITVRDKDGTLTGDMESLDQGPGKTPVDKIEVKEKIVTLHMAKVGAKFTGSLSDDGKQLTGFWEQSGGKFAIVLKRGDTIEGPKRPQTPPKDVEYVVRNVTFENPKAKFTLAGTLTQPKGDGPFPAVVLISGSGPSDRDETLFQHKPFAVLAHHLTSNGIAVLRYDDRGVGQSKGKYKDATTVDFAQDAEAAVLFLKEQKGIDPKRVGLCGHSEGGLIAPIVAAGRPEDVSFIVLLAGTGVSGEEIMQQQRLDIHKSLGIPEKECLEINEILGKFTKISIAEDGTLEERRKKFMAYAQELTPQQRATINARTDKDIEVLANRIFDPWNQTFHKLDPAVALKKTRCRVLALNGEKDLQVHAGLNLPAIEKSLKAGLNPPAEFHKLPGLNHMFQPAKTGQVAEYGKIETTFDEATMKRISTWILK